jgi:hypothetical protein
MLAWITAMMRARIVVYIYLDRLQTWMFRGRKQKAAFGNAAPQPAE